MTGLEAPTAAFFDLDKTVIATSSTFAFSRPFHEHGLLNRRAMVLGAYSHLVYRTAGADHDRMERMREQVSGLVAGWDVELVRAVVAATLERRIAPLVHPEAVALIARHREAGRDVVLVSASGSELVEPIGAMLGVDRVIATRMVERDGRWTGEIAFYAYGENKAVALRAAAAEHGYDLDGSYAYSDSVTDLPMLCAVGHPCAVNPDRALRREAAVRGWPVLDVAPLGAGGVLASVPRQRRLLRDAVRRREQG